MPERRRCRRDERGEPCGNTASSLAFGDGCSGGSVKCGVDEGKCECVGDAERDGELGWGGELGRKGGEGCVARLRGRCCDMLSLMAV